MVEIKEAALFANVGAMLGEGPVWDEKRNCLFSVDIMGKKLFRTELDGSTRTYDLGQMCGTLPLCEDGDLLLALQDGLYFFNPDTEEKTFFTMPLERDPEMRFNDGKVDPAGRFFVGSQPMSREKIGALYLVDHDGSSKLLIPDQGCPNGQGWSMDRKTMYYINSPDRCVWAFDYNEETSEISNRRAVVTFPEGDRSFGVPDGMCVDAEDMIWVAHFGGRRVTRFDPRTGEELMRVTVNAMAASCPTFGGPDMDTLFITTAGRPQEGDVPGAVYAIKLPVKGQVAYRFKKA